MTVGMLAAFVRAPTGVTLSMLGVCGCVFHVSQRSAEGNAVKEAKEKKVLNEAVVVMRKCRKPGEVFNCQPRDKVHNFSFWPD